MKNIAVMGYGVVGSGVVEVLEKNRESIERKAGHKLNLKYILDLRDFPGDPHEKLFIKDFHTILMDPSVDVVVEVMGGVEPAYTYVKRLLESGKSVVTSNKELVAAKGAELLHIARHYQVNFLFEASVGGGIPIIRPLHLCLAANEIREIAGILNGTTNFILTKMIREQMPFPEALALAQKLGYAERDPAADIEGKDACRKICILASLAYGNHIYPDYVHTEGIAQITLEDVAYAESWGGVIKLIGRAKKLENGKLSVMVSPAVISHGSQLSTVDDVFNGILVRADATGDVVFYGRGAGKLPTASAVMGDVVDCAKAQGTIRSLSWVDTGENTVEDYRLYESEMIVRLSGPEAPAKVEAAFGPVRSLSRKGQPADEYAFVTPRLAEGEMERRLAALQSQGLALQGRVRTLDY